MLLSRCLLPSSKLVNRSGAAPWQLSLTGLIYFTSRYFGKNTCVSLKGFGLEPVLCRIWLLCAAEPVKAGFLQISLLRSHYPPSSFPCPGATAPPRSIPGCPLSGGELCPLGRLWIHLCCELPGFGELPTLRLAVAQPASGKMTSGRRRAGEKRQAGGRSIRGCTSQGKWDKKGLLAARALCGRIICEKCCV